ncbi:MAG: hypothetical protein UU64_C0002G0085 [candidate division WWE3 bacterium GW2011_GWF2_41_45]|nr:MAG: hypothetical protein UU55_C0001G0033 [candidate division WWE3 bacterium GW2011_GWC2_41_23]KKS10683.1 MAG: hypothetical protein UU64_C0002G0085 [candidate division WWE3 bacterium GW2011_GWF2_41_45]KKS12306.1 MAG: hypothetical protein UU68_C0002G0032 [candidate division WWE3 bacterium GW2011_GWF1_41_53]KKS20380.1 MAG: hypothetical protein UU79_C0001G0034 [candidate division WWE3 bacterium GW2011_GWE1_41_72]KKS25847.1 MAG: hypothetical protein UU86_C0049G0003 [candidate division WWE3 bacte
MRTKVIVGVIAWIVVFSAGVLAFTQPDEMSGTDIFKQTNYSRRFFIETKGVAFSAGSPYLFILRNSMTGEILHDENAPAPFGWQHKEYFGVSLENMPKGEWLIEMGRNVSLEFISTDSLELAFKLTSEALMLRVFAAFLLASGFAGFLLKIMLRN